MSSLSFYSFFFSMTKYDTTYILRIIIKTKHINLIVQFIHIFILTNCSYVQVYQKLIYYNFFQ